MDKNQGAEAVIYEDKALNAKTILIVLGVLALVAIALYGYFNIYSNTPATDTVLVSADIPPTVAVEPEAKATDIVEDFGFAEVSTTFVSPRSVADAVAYYMAAIVEKGGTIETTMRTPEKEIIVAKTAQGTPYVVYVGDKGGETVVTINVDPVQ